jgi:hypothetical protein
MLPASGVAACAAIEKMTNKPADSLFIIATYPVNDQILLD